MTSTEHESKTQVDKETPDEEMTAGQIMLMIAAFLFCGLLYWLCAPVMR